MKFVAIDFETANPCLSSICQIGIATFENGAHTGTWNTLINPDDYFDSTNVTIHGITEADVKNAPRFPDVFEQLRTTLSMQIIAHHTAFDRISLNRAMEKHALPAFECSWLDTAKVVRRTWSEYSQRGYGLANVAAKLKIVFKHHAAHEDARAAGEILLRAIVESGLSLEEWLSRVERPIDLNGAGRKWQPSPDVAREGNPEGPLAGETMVFTGALSMSRQNAADLAAEAGCDVAEGVTKHTTMLVVGDQDIRMLAGQEKSSKHRKAEALMAKGKSIRILGESDFRRLVEKIAPMVEE